MKTQKILSDNSELNTSWVSCSYTIYYVQKKKKRQLGFLSSFFTFHSMGDGARGCWLCFADLEVGFVLQMDHRRL